MQNLGIHTTSINKASVANQYWHWRRAVSLIVLITFSSSLLSPVFAAYSPIDSKTNHPNIANGKNKDILKNKVSKTKQDSVLKYQLASGLINPQENRQIDEHKNPIFLSKNKYQPYLEVGGAKYFNQTSTIAGIYDLFIPLVQQDDQLLFTDLRIFDRSGGSFEGNAHIGYRKQYLDTKQMFGIYAAFDRKRSDVGNRFNQITLGFEYWQNNWFVGGNVYKPLGKTKKFVGAMKEKTSRSIVTTKYYEKSLPGVDAEIGYSFTDNVTGYVGGYYFHSGDTNTIAGPKARLTYNYNKPHGRILGILDGVSVEVGAQHDKPRGNTAYIGIKLKVGLTNFEKNSNISGFERHMVELVRRDPDIIIGKGQETHKRERFYQDGEYGFQEGDKPGSNSGKQDNKESKDNKNNKSDNKGSEDIDFGNWNIVDLLKELNLSRDATEADVKKRYIDIMRKQHPDKGGSHEAAVRLNSINDAIKGKKHLLAKEKPKPRASNFPSSSNFANFSATKNKSSRDKSYQESSTSKFERAFNRDDKQNIQNNKTEGRYADFVTRQPQIAILEGFGQNSTEIKEASLVGVKKEFNEASKKTEPERNHNESFYRVYTDKSSIINIDNSHKNYLPIIKNTPVIGKNNLAPRIISNGYVAGNDTLHINQSRNNAIVKKQRWLKDFFGASKSLIIAPINLFDRCFNAVLNMFMLPGANALVIENHRLFDTSTDGPYTSDKIAEIEQKAREQLNKNGYLDSKLTEVIFDLYAKDQSYFTDLIRDILAQDKNIPIVTLNKLVSSFLLIKDKSAALFIASRLLLRKVKLPENVINYFIDFLSADDKAIYLRAIDLFYQLDQKMPEKIKQRLIDAIIDLLPKFNNIPYSKLIEILDKLELTKRQGLRREAQELIADWGKALTVKEKKDIGRRIVKKVTNITSKDMLDFYRVNLNAQHYELYTIARELLADLNKYEELFWSEKEQELIRMYAAWKNSSKKCFFDDSIHDLPCLAVNGGEILLTKKQKNKLNRVFDEYPWLEDEIYKIAFVNYEEIDKLINLVLVQKLRKDEVSKAIDRYSWPPTLDNVYRGLLNSLLEELKEKLSISDGIVLKTSVDQLVDKLNWPANIIFCLLKKGTKKSLPELTAILEVLTDYAIDPYALNRYGSNGVEILEKNLSLEKLSDESSDYLGFDKLYSNLWSYLHSSSKSQELKQAYDGINLLIRDYYFYLDKDNDALIKEFSLKNLDNKKIQKLIVDGYFEKQLHDIKKITDRLMQPNKTSVGNPQNYKKDNIYLYKKTELIKTKDGAETKEQSNICLASTLKKVCFNKDGNKEEKETFVILEDILKDNKVNDTFVCRTAAKKGMISNSYKCLSLMSWEEADFKEWRRIIKKVNKQNLAEVIAVLSQAAHNTILEGAWYPRSAQIIALLSLLKSSDGGLAQISTGEGKSLIDAMFAAIKVMNGRKVDITTSSEELAKRELDEKKSKIPNFFHYFGITVSHNINDDGGPKKCYQSDVVYGDLTHFIGDTLKDITRNVKMGRGTDILVVDEVDNMFIDEIRMLVQLSWPMPGFALLNQIFVYMWGMATSSMQYLEKKDNKWHIKVPLPKNETLAEIIEDIGLDGFKPAVNKDEYLFEVGDDLGEFLQGLVTNYTSETLLSFNHGREHRKVIVPSHLENFAKEQLPAWVESLISSYAIKNKGQYLIHVDPNSILSKNATIIAPVDYKNTGTIQTNMHWSNGLHQFLQIANGVTIQPESLISIFMSYVEFFNKYKGSIYGVTGTAGKEPHHSFLEQVYGIETSIIPTFAPKDFREFKPIIVRDRVDWYQAIIDIIMRKIKDKRPCLVIFELMEDVEKLREFLIKFDYPEKQIFTYGIGGNDEGKIFEDYKLKIGDIVIATNMAGRGTDLKISRDALKNGGLHLIMTVFSKSLRVEMQAFGRPARKGEPGSGQLVIFVDTDEPCQDIHCLRDKRDKVEMQTLRNDRLVKLPAMKIKDQLFSAYIEFMRQIDSTTRYKVKIGRPDATNTTLYLYLDGNDIYLNDIKISETLKRIDADLKTRISNVLRRSDSTIADLNKYDYEAILFIAAENNYRDNSFFSSSVQLDYANMISGGFNRKDIIRLEYFGEIGVTNNFWNVFYSSGTTKRKFLLWLVNRVQFSKKEEVNQLDEDWGIWLRKQDGIFQELHSLNNKKLDFDTLNTERVQLKGRLYKEFEAFKEQELIKFNKNELIINPAYYVNKADRYFLQRYFYEKGSLVDKFLDEAISFTERALQLDNYYTWAANSAKSAICLYKGSVEVKKMEEEDKNYEGKVKRAYEVKKQFYDNSLVVIKNIRDVYIPIEESQLFSLSSLSLLNYTDENAMQFIGTIAIYNEMIKVEQDNLKLIAEAKEDETIEIDSFIKISDLADNVNISQEIANVYKSANVTGIEFKNKKLVLEQIEAAGINEIPKIKVYKLEDNRSYSGNFLGIFIGIASIFTGCWMIGAFHGIFATAFATSLVFGGVGEILTYSYSLIKGQPINFKDVLSSKGMSLGISLATAGTLFLLDKITWIHNLMGPNFVGNMANVGKNVGLAFAIQATTMAATGLLYEFGRKLVDIEAIKKEAREAIKRIIEICKEKLRRIFATDFFNDNNELIGVVYKKIEAIVTSYMERFKGEGAVFGRGVATSTASHLITGLPYLGNMINAGTDIIMNSIKSSEAISEITEGTMKAILEINNQALKTGDMLAKKLKETFNKEEADEMMIAIKEQKYVVSGEIDYNNCNKFDSLNLRKELLPRKIGIVEGCMDIQKIMTNDYKNDVNIFEDRFVELIANAKKNIQKEIIESTASVPGGIIGQYFGEMIYGYAKGKLDELRAKNKNKEPQFAEEAPKTKEKENPKDKKKSKPEEKPKSDKKSEHEPKKEPKPESGTKANDKASKDTGDKQSKGSCTADGTCSSDKASSPVNSENGPTDKKDSSNKRLRAEAEAAWITYEDELKKHKIEGKTMEEKYNNAINQIEDLKILKKDGYIFFGNSGPNGDGFSAIALKKTGENGGEILISMRGVEPFDIHDLANALQIAQGKVPNQYKHAQAFINKIKQNIGANDKIFLTGQSMGGVLAQMGSAEFGFPATAWESPGAKEIIKKQFGDKNYDPSKITIINAQPNAVNTHGPHVNTPIEIDNGAKPCISSECYIKGVFFKKYSNSHKMETLLNGVNAYGTYVRALKQNGDSFTINRKEYDSASQTYDKQIYRIWEAHGSFNPSFGPLGVLAEAEMINFRIKYPTYDTYKNHVLNNLVKDKN